MKSDRMPIAPENSGPAHVFTSTAAHVFVSDVAASYAFFIDKLGFTLDFAYGDPPFYAEVMSGNARLALRFVHGPIFIDEARRSKDLLSATLTVASASELAALFARYRDAGVAFHQMLRVEPWGATTFIVSDPDGNLILVAGPADD